MHKVGNVEGQNILRLELGSGDRPFGGDDWVHQDIRELPHIEIVCDAQDLGEIPNESYHELRATHLLEHFSYRKTVEILKEWARVLVPGGFLYIEVPNLKWQAQAYISGEISGSEFVYYAYGEQDHKGNYHYAAFDEGTLRKVLMDAGYVVVGITDIGQVLCVKAIK